MKKLDKKISVDELLNNINYGDMNNYIPSKFSISMVNFIKIINGGQEANKTPIVHYKMLDGLVDNQTYLANLCSRGLAKTSIFAEYLFLYLAVFRSIPNFGVVDTAIYVADSMDNGAKSLRKNIESRYEKSAVLKQLLPEAKFTDGYIQFKNAKDELFGFKLFGAKSGIRGTKIFAKRPVLAVLDDLVSDEDASSPVLLQKIKTTIYAGVLPALDPTRRKVIFNGTPFNKNDPLYEAVESGEWFPNVYPVCEVFPCSKDEFKGAWEDRFTYEGLMRDYNLAVGTGKIKEFRQEYMLRIASEEDRMISNDDLRWFNVQDIMLNPQKYNFVITTDFATSTQRKADNTVIGVWALDANHNRYLVDGVIGRQLMNKTFDDVFSLVQKYNVISVGIEISGQQGAFISLIRNEMMSRNVYFNIAKGKDGNREGIPARKNKMERFRLSIPFWKAGKMFLPKELKHTLLVQQILEELSMVTIDGIKAKNDDCLDMISQLEQMHLTFPDNQQAQLQKKSVYNSVIYNDGLMQDDLNQETVAHTDYLV